MSDLICQPLSTFAWGTFTSNERVWVIFYHRSGSTVYPLYYFFLENYEVSYDHRTYWKPWSLNLHLFFLHVIIFPRLTNWQDCLIFTVYSATMAKVTVLVLFKLKMKAKTYYSTIPIFYHVSTHSQENNLGLGWKMLPVH